MTEAIAEPVEAEAEEVAATEASSTDAEVEPVASPADAENAAEMEEAVAKVKGEPFLKLPDDLYIPPEALQVFLEAFQGPLDLLLYLIKKNNLDILDIPIAQVTAQYIEYVELMRDLQLELAADYLVMAAMLAEIKSRLLLPRPEEEEGAEEDPRAELVRRLQEYERFKLAAERIDKLPRRERDVFAATAEKPVFEVELPEPEVDLRDVILAFADIMRRIENKKHHMVQREPLSIRERMSEVLDKLRVAEFAEFPNLFKQEEGRAGVVVTFIAILELLRQSLITMVQAGPFSPIHVRACTK